MDLQVPVAYHSHHVDACCQPLEQSLQDLDPSEPTIPLVSSVTGQAVTEAPDVQYWVNNMRQPVLFHQVSTCHSATSLKEYKITQLQIL